jgi:hypothetical protein
VKSPGLKGNYASEAEPWGGGRLESRKKTAGCGLVILCATITFAIATLLTLNVTGAAIRATWCAAMHSVQS